jgi:uncharacterized Zn ribbon protein
MTYDDKNIDWENWERNPDEDNASDDNTDDENQFIVKDANGNILQE